MTNADQVRASDTEQGNSEATVEASSKEERRRLGPLWTDAQLNEFKALLHQL